MRTTSTTGRIPSLSPLSSIETRYRGLIGLLLISPWLAGLVIFKLVPIAASFALSFSDFHLLDPGQTRFVGFNNYIYIMTDAKAGTAFVQTVRLALEIIPLQMFASIFFAALLSSRSLLMKDTLRTLFFLPSIIPAFAAALMWQGFVNPSTGWLNRLLLRPLGLTALNHFSTRGASPGLFILSSLWTVGPGILIMMGSMQGISSEIYEAARIDGAGRLTRFFKITLPLITPAVFFTLVLNLTAALGGAILMDRGNGYRANAFSSYDGYVNTVLLDRLQLGYASSLAWVFFVFVIIVVMILFSTSNRWVYFPDREQ